MFFLQPMTACCKSKRLWCGLDRPSRGTRSPSIQRRLTPTWSRHSDFHSDARRLRVLGAVSTKSETPSEHKEDAPSFDWFKNWWMVQAVANLETDKPNKIKLLNRDFVVWKGHSGEWIVMDDECPHRLAPLSEGRIEKDGNLLCSYHAWRFNESGKCVNIPHADDEKAHSVACNSSRSAVQTYPCKVRGALLWIWPDRSISAFSDAENTSIPIEDDLADFLDRSHEEGLFVPFLMHFPASYDSLVENIFDESHIQGTHHGAIPNCSRYDTAPTRARLSEDVANGRAIFSMKYTDPPLSNDGTVKLRIPGTCTYDVQNEEGGPIERTYITCSPRTKTQTAVVFIQLQDYQILSTKKPNIIERALAPFLNVYYHLYVLQISDADIALVMNQALKTKAEGFEFNKRFYLPSNADISVTAFRKWFETVGQRGAAYGGNEPVDPSVHLSRDQALNRFENYTRNSKLGTAALKNTETALSVLRSVRLASAIVGGAFLVRVAETGSLPLASDLKNVPFIVSVLVLCCSIPAVNMLDNLRSQFYYGGYDFSERN